MPRQNRMAFFLTSHASMESYLDTCLRDPAELIDDWLIRQDATHACDMVIGESSLREPKSDYPAHIINKVFKIIALLDDKGLFERALPLRLCIDASADRAISFMVDRYGASWTRDRLTSQLLKIKSYADRFLAVERIANCLYICDRDEVSLHTVALQHLRLQTIEDGTALVKLALLWEGRRDFHEVLLLAIENNAGCSDFNSTAMIMSFLEGLSSVREIPTNVFVDLVPLAVRTLAFPELQKSETSRHYLSVSRVLCHCYKLSLASEVQHFVDNLMGFDSSDRSGDPKLKPETSLMPFLIVLAEVLPKEPPLLLVYRSLQEPFRHVLSKLVSLCVPPKPPPPANWTTPPLPGCGCHDCRTLGAFFLDSEREHFDFHRDQPEQSHLEQILQSCIRNRTIKATTIRVGSPHTLTVQKLRKEYTDKLQEWLSKSADVKKVLGISFGPKILTPMFGEHYATIMSLRPIPAHAFRHVPASAVAPVLSRPVVVDLTADESDDDVPIIANKSSAPLLPTGAGPRLPNTPDTTQAPPAANTSTTSSSVIGTISAGPSTSRDHVLTPLGPAAGNAINRIILPPRRSHEVEDEKGNKRHLLANGTGVPSIGLG